MVRDLVVQAQNGERDAFAALVHMTSDRMYALAARILRDNDLAEDALQGALITVWRQLPTLRDPDRFEPWVRRLLVHACYAEATSRARTSPASTVWPRRPCPSSRPSRSSDDRHGGGRHRPPPKSAEPHPLIQGHPDFARCSLARPARRQTPGASGLAYRRRHDPNVALP
jgi:DNA-directed RNA polymerase specialized sigma24 family protein